MSDVILTSLVELTDAELDYVSGSAANSGAAAGAVGLVAVAAGVSAAADNLVNNNHVLTNNNIPITVGVAILGQNRTG